MKKAMMVKAKEPKEPSVTIKFYEVIEWLFSRESQLPEKFKMNPQKLNGIVPYLTEQFWAMPQLTSYLNKHTNDLFNIGDPIEVLKLFKKIIISQGLTKANCWNFFPVRKPDLLKELQERDQLDEGNAKSKRMLMNKLNIESSHYFRAAPTKKGTDLNNPLTKQMVKDVIIQEKKRKIKLKEDAQKNDSRYLQRLDQQIIDELKLIIFDVSLLKKTNRVLFTFIDNNNLKRYFITPFSADIYLSKRDGVINNDYIEDNCDDFIHYVIKDFKLYNKLKYMLNASYKKILNEGF